MYKLTVIAGPNRGTSYAVQDGEVSVGRQTGNTIVLPSSKVSKKHCVFQVNGTEIVLKDLGSSNGTFVNGLLTKLRKIKPGDRVSVGEYVLQLVEPVTRIAGAAPAVGGFGQGVQLPTASSSSMIGISQSSQPGAIATTNTSRPPQDIKGKAIWYFEHRFMPLFYVLNLKYEWRMICVGGFAAFIIGNLLISVYPLLESSRATIIKETGKRAKYMAREIAERNAPFLAAKAETKTDVGMAENADGVRQALLLDLDNRIIAPGAKMNQYLTSGSEANVAVQSRDMFRAGRETGYVVQADMDTVVAVEPVKVINPAAARNVVVAMALVSIDTTLSTPDVGEMGIVYSETLILTGILGGLILLILYRMTLRPLEILNEDMDKALKGDLPQVTHEFKFEELNSLWEIINSAIQRIPKSGGGGGGLDGGAFGGGITSIDEFLGPLKMIGGISKYGLVIFDSERKIVHVNSMFEEISGIRSDGAIGHDMSEVARDQAMGSFTKDLLDRTPVGGEGLAEDFDFSGITYKVHAVAFGSPGGSGKCFAIALVRAEG